MVTHLEDISRAAGDELLVERIVSAAAEAGIDNPEGWARLNARRVVATPITEAVTLPRRCLRMRSLPTSPYRAPARTGRRSPTTTYGLPSLPSAPPSNPKETRR